MTELGKSILYVILIAILLIAFALAPAAVGVAELAERQRIEQGQ